MFSWIIYHFDSNYSKYCLGLFDFKNLELDLVSIFILSRMETLKIHTAMVLKAS